MSKMCSPFSVLWSPAMAASDWAEAQDFMDGGGLDQGPNFHPVTSQGLGALLSEVVGVEGLLAQDSLKHLAQR